MTGALPEEPGGGADLPAALGWRFSFVKTAAASCRLKIRPGECVSCAACPAVCHTLALRMDALALVLDEALCDNCSLCVRVCPVGALYLETTQEGFGAHDPEHR